MRRKNTLFYGALLLTGAGLLLRAAATVFQILLSRRLGPGVMGLLQLILSVKGLAYTIGAGGIRTCALYLAAKGREGSAVRAGCCRCALAWSLPVALGLWGLAPWLAETWIGSLDALPALRLFALALPFSSLCGVLAACLTAAGRIRVLAATEFLEQGCAMALTWALLSAWAERGPAWACLAVAAGGCAAALVSLWALSALARQSREPGGPPPYGRILSMALPLGLADSLRAALGAMEHLMVPRRLARYPGTADALADYGILQGMAFPVLLFPAALLTALADLLVPELSRCTAAGSRRRVRYLARRGLRISILFGLAAGSVFFAGGGALGTLLFRSAPAGACLTLYAPLLPMLYADALVDAMCRGLGQQRANARYNLLTSLLDGALLWCLLPRLGLRGFFLSFALSHLVNFGLSLRRLVRVSGIRSDPALALRALLAAAAAGMLARSLCRRESWFAVLLAGGACLGLLVLLWRLLGVVGARDLPWLRGLLAGEPPAIDKRRRE